MVVRSIGTIYTTIYRVLAPSPPWRRTQRYLAGLSRNFSVEDVGDADEPGPGQYFGPESAGFHALGKQLGAPVERWWDATLLQANPNPDPETASVSYSTLTLPTVD